MRLKLGLMALAAALTSGLGWGTAAAESSFVMESYHDQCGDRKRLYASCLNQKDVLSDGLEAAKKEGRLAVIVLGFNDCPPCYVLDRWMKTEEAKALLAPYTVIKLSIFDAARDLRPEVFGEIIPQYSLPINTKPPFGVPYFFVFDPQKNQLHGEGIAGFDSRDQSRHIAYLQENTAP